VQIVEFHALLAAERLSDVLPGSGACCDFKTEPRNLLITTPKAANDKASVAKNGVNQSGLVC
jgi:hypothetical protein